MHDKGQNYLIFAAGTVLGVLTIGLMGVNTAYQFSPVIKIAIFCLLSLFLALVGLFAGKPLDYSVYILSFSSFIVALNLGLATSSLDTATHLVFTALGSATFLGTGYALQQDLIRPRKSHFKVYAIIVLAALILTAGYDLSGPQPSYNFIPYENPEVNRTGGLEVGTMIVHNRFHFPRVVSLPEYHACIYGPEFVEKKSVQIQNPDMIEAGNLQQLKISTALGQETVSELEIEDMDIVKRRECTEQNVSNQIIIAPAENPNILTKSQ